MKKEDIEELKEIVQLAKRLEELIAEVEGPLTDKQKENLDQEFFCMDASSVRPIGDVVSRIDSALHHPEEYPDPEPEPPFDGNVATVYADLCEIRDQWDALFMSKKINELMVYLTFSRWTKLIYKYTEYICCKYNLKTKALRIGSIRMERVLGTCGLRRGIVYNRILIVSPSYAIMTNLHETCHLKYSGHSPEFWQFYEDMCINEGFLLKRILGKRRSFRNIPGHIPYRWDLELRHLSQKETNAIEKWMRRSRSFIKTLENTI